MSTAYTAVLQNIVTGRITAELPVTSGSATSILNAPGNLEVSIPLRTDDVALTAADIDERRNAVFMLRDDTVVGEGIIETQRADVRENSVTLGCLGWHNWVRNIFLHVDAFYSSADQTLIAKDLVRIAATKSGAIPIGVDNVVASGRLRDRTYYAYERHSIGELVDNLAAVIDGFNFYYRSTRGAEGYTTEFLTQYPGTGRPTNYVFELGGNVELLGLTGDGSTMANFVETIGGQGNTVTPAIAQAVDVDILANTPLWEAVETYTDVTELGTLSEKAQQRLARGRTPVRVPTLSIGAGVEPRLGTYMVGDRVRVRGDYGLLNVDADYLITQLQVDAALDVVSLTVAPVAALL